MAPSNKKWDQNIAKAVKELDGKAQRNNNARSITLPDWVPYLSLIALGFLLAKFIFTGGQTHPMNEQRSYSKANKVAILMVAEDIESFREARGYLPDEPPNGLAKMLNMSYEKTDDFHFRLIMQHQGSTIVFDESEDSLSMSVQ